MEEKCEELGPRMDELEGENTRGGMRSFSNGNHHENKQISLFIDSGYNHHAKGANPKPPMTFEDHLQSMDEISRKEILRLAVNGERVRAISSTEGLRPGEIVKLGKDYSEDRHVIFTNGETKDHNDFSGFAIFDGHGSSPEYAELGVRVFREDLLTKPFSSQDNIHEYLYSSIQKMHKNAETSLGGKHGGSTALIGLVLGNEANIANLGDSIAILIRKEEGKAVVVEKTTDHDIHNEDEKLRLKQFLDSGEVQFEGHYMIIDVSGVKKRLMVTRALGDWDFGPFLCRDPDFYKWNLENEDIIIFASDGLAEIKDVEGGFFRGCLPMRLPNILEVIDKNVDFANLSEELAQGQIDQVVKIHRDLIDRLQATDVFAYRNVIRQNRANPKTVFCQDCRNSRIFCKECYLKEYGNNFRVNRDNQDIICYKHESPKQKSGNPRSFSY